MPKEEKHMWKDMLIEEVKKLSITVIYLWVLLSVFGLHRAMILSEYHISSPWRWGFALVNALILAKFMLIAEAVHAGEKTESKPLLYSILFQPALFSGILMVCHTVEEVLVRMWHGNSFARSLPQLNEETVNEILSMGIIMFVVLIPFFAARELSRVLGKDEFKLLLLSRGTNIGRSQSKV